jgi:phosphoserine/homoserine phosphotransferase
MMKKLAWPTLFCNDLIVNNNDQIVDYRLRQKDGKKFAVQGFHSMGLKVVAAGDSYNDLSMIREANGGVLFCPPEQIVKDNPDLPVALNYADFYDYISEIIGTAKVKA